MSLSQPALSHKLKKLRSEFDDQLFVRAARGVTPTPKAHALAPQVLELVSGLEAFYQQTEQHDFLQRHDVVHLYSTDYLEQLILPQLLPKLHQQAPNLQLVTHNTRGRLPKAELESGECDIAIAGFFTDLPDTFYQQPLYREDFVVLASKHNPKLTEEEKQNRKMTFETYLSSPHVITTLTGDLNGLVDKVLAKQGKQRKIVAGISSFLAPPMLIKQSEFVLTCLRSIAEEAAKHYCDLLIFEIPVTVKPIEVVQTWHRRTHGDQLRRWLRQQIKQQCEALSSEPYPGDLPVESL